MLDQANQSDRRHSNRLRFNLPITYQPKLQQTIKRSIARDISSTGIRFISDEFLPIQSQYVIETTHPINKKQVKVLSEIVWESIIPHSEQYTVGAKFIDPNNIF